MNTRNAAKLLLASLILGGCASYNPQDVEIKEALQEREEASNQVLRCAPRSDSQKSLSVNRRVWMIMGNS